MDPLECRSRFNKFAAMVFIVFLVASAGCEKPSEQQDANQEKVDQASESIVKAKTPTAQSATQIANSQDEDANKPEEPDWIDEGVALLDDESLDGWEEIEFGGEGDITIENGILDFTAGDPFTGISSTGDDHPKTNYEISLEGRKMDGTDFFCGLTFPVADSHCTLIAGGWGGATVGLSCINDKDASSNDTCTYMKFEKKQWYKIRVRVQPKSISVWIDDKQVVNQNIEGKKISLRGDTELCKPIGICSFMTGAEFKNVRIRKFNPMDQSAAADKETAPKKPEAVDKK